MTRASDKDTVLDMGAYKLRNAPESKPGSVEAEVEDARVRKVTARTNRLFNRHHQLSAAVLVAENLRRHYDNTQLDELDSLLCFLRVAKLSDIRQLLGAER